MTDKQRELHKVLDELKGNLTEVVLKSIEVKVLLEKELEKQKYNE